MESLRNSYRNNSTIRKVMCAALLFTLSCSRDHDGGQKQIPQNDTIIAPHQSHDIDQYRTADSIRQANHIITDTLTTSRDTERKQKRQQRLQEIGNNMKKVKENIAQAISGTAAIKDTSSH